MVLSQQENRNVMQHPSASDWARLSDCLVTNTIEDQLYQAKRTLESKFENVVDVLELVIGEWCWLLCAIV